MREQLRPLLEKYPETSPAGKVISEVISWNSFINQKIASVQKHILNLGGGHTLEFYPLESGDEMITRLTSEKTDPSTWVISDKRWAVNELSRVLGRTPSLCQDFIDTFDYSVYPKRGEHLNYFTAWAKEDGYASKSLYIALVSDTLIAYWISNISGVIGRGWTTPESIYDALMHAQFLK